MSDTKINSIDLINYSHDREAHYKVTADELFNLINNYTDQKQLLDIYRYFEQKYQIPASVAKQTIRQYISRSYILKSGKFNSKLRVKNIFGSIIKKYSSLLYAFFFIKIKQKVKKFELIIDYINSEKEMVRWEKLLNIFGRENVLCITRELNLKKKFPKYHFYNKKILQGINLLDLIKTLVNELLFGVWIILGVSIKTKVNLFPVTFNILHDYLTFRSLFKSNKAKYIIQEKHYATEPVKNYLFKKFGGVASTSIQKNIIANEPIFFYMDLDILFSLGKNSFGTAYEYGGRIKKVHPVGSLFMERGWFDQKREIKQKFDLVILGINTSNAYQRLDSFNKFMDDHYSLYRWAAKFSIENPKYRIASIQHTSSGNDKIIEKILSESNVNILDKDINSYEIAFASNCGITYGSTMGYELNAHNKKTLFIDPGFRCMFLPEKGLDYIDILRIETYDKFNSMVKDIIEKKNINNLDKDTSENLCLESSNVSETIYKILANI